MAIVWGVALCMVLVSSFVTAEDRFPDRGRPQPEGVIVDIGSGNRSLVLDNGMRVLIQGVFSVIGKDGKPISPNRLHRGDRVAVEGEMGIGETLFASRIVLVPGSGPACSTGTEREHEQKHEQKRERKQEREYEHEARDR